MGYMLLWIGSCTSLVYLAWPAHLDSSLVSHQWRCTRMYASESLYRTIILAFRPSRRVRAASALGSDHLGRLQRGEL